MYGYAGASAAATTVTPFNPPPQTTNPAGTGTQAAAVTQAAASPAGATQNMLSQVPAALQSLASAPQQVALSILNSPWITDFEKVSSALGGYLGGLTAIQDAGAGVIFDSTAPITALIAAGGAIAPAPAAAVSAVSAPEGALGTLAGSYGSGVGGGGVSAGLGQAATVGGLSVPQSWATASPAIRLAASALPAAGLDSLPQAGPAGLGGWSGGMPMMGGVVNAPRNGAAGARPESRLKVIPQLAGESGVHEGTPGRRGNAPRGNGPSSEREELNGLRQAIAELAKERDVLMRSAARLIKEATS
jgi:PPE-repeat protein